jgi:hypothetical protein
MTNTNHSLPKGTSDEHYTPKALFESLKVRFDLDVAAAHKGTNSQATQWLCKCCNDGLTTDWHGNVWMNPPYSLPTPWVEKFVDHGFGIALLPMTRGRWFDKIWQAADAIVPLAYNYKFERPDNLPSKPIVFRTALFAIGQDNAQALQHINARVR